MTPRCGHQWSTENGAPTAHHTCIRRPRHEQACMCACGGTPPRAGPP